MPTTSVDLFRGGTSGSPQLDRVRVPKDISTFYRNGLLYVKAGTGGVSVLEKPLSVGKWWWRLPAKTLYSGYLHLVHDHTGHWQWEPSFDMSLTEYRAELAALNPFFIRL
jgi:hypothetical protein